MTPQTPEIQALQAENSQLKAMIATLRAGVQPAETSQFLQPEEARQLAYPLLPGLIFLDEAGRIRHLDERSQQLTLLSPALLLGRPLLEALPPATWPAQIESLLERAQAFRYEVHLDARQAETERVWLRVRAIPTPATAHTPAGYVCALDDITADMHQHLQLAASELHCRSLIENAPVVLYEWRENFDNSYEWLYASPKLGKLFGLSQEDVGQLNRYIHPEDVQRWRQTIEDSKRLKQPWHFEGRLQVPGQPLRWWRGSSIITAQDNRGIVYQGILEDITQTRTAQQTIQINEQRWRMAMEGVGSDIWELNLRTMQLQLSDKFGELLGYRRWETPDHQIELDYANVVPADVERARTKLLAHLRGETPLFTATYRLTDAQGLPHWIASRGIISKRNEAGEPEILTGTHTDVTEITQAKLNLEASTRRLVSTVANLQRAVLLEDEHERVVLVNASFCELFALPSLPEELTGTKCAALFEQLQLRAHNVTAFGRNVQQRRKHRQEVHDESIALKDGRILEHTTLPLYVEGQYIGRLWKYEDVTKRRTEAEALKRREEKYRSILENMNMGLVEVDLQGRIQFANDSYCEITGYTKHELQDKKTDQLLVPQTGHLPVSGVRGPYPLNTYELHIRTKSNELKWLLVSEAPLWNDEKRVVGSIGVHLDITHQKQLESKLRDAKRHAEESTKAKEMFLANMSHEIRTPMNAILGMSQLLAKTPLVKQQHNYLHAIFSSAENLLVIINDILDLSKIDAGQMTLESIGFNMRKLCEQVEKTLRYKAEDKGLMLRIEVSPDLPEVLLGDPYRITQVLLNLAGNSVKFTEKGEVCLTCRLTGSFPTAVIVQFQVRDTGIGIDPLYLRHLFKNFSQEDSSVSRKYGGTGLGLSISRRLVNLMGSELHIESEKNNGTTSTFSLQLPVGREQDLPRKEVTGNTRVVREGLRGKRVLLAEDNDYNRLLAVSFLTQAQMLVTEAQNGAVAVELARNHPFDVVLMDVQMPVMNGYEATQKLRQELGLRTPIIALTANAIRGDNQRCLDAGMDDYLSKPFQEDDLLKLIHKWLTPAPEPTPAPALPPVQEEKLSSGRLYCLTSLQQVANHDTRFITLMLNTFIRSSQEVMASLREQLQQKNAAGIRAAAHKLKPSLHHLQITPVLQIIQELEESPDPLDPLVTEHRIADVHRLLGHVIAQMQQELDALPG